MHKLLDNLLAQFGLNADVPPNETTWRELVSHLDTTLATLDTAQMRYRAMFEQSNDAIMIMNLHGTCMAANQSAAMLLGYTINEMVGLTIRELVSPREQKLSEVTIEFLKDGNIIAPYERAVLRKNGTEMIVEISAELIDDIDNPPAYIQLKILDISHREATQTALHHSEERFQELIARIPVGILLQGPQAEILLDNSASLDLLGLTEDQLLGRSSFDPDWNVIHEDGSPFPGDTHPVPQAIATKQPVHNVVMGVYRPASHERGWLLVNAEPLLNADGSLREVICTFSDITELKKTENLLLKEQNRYRELLAASERQTRELQLLNDLRTAIGHELDLKTLIPTIVEGVAHEFGYQHTSLYLLRGDTLYLQHYLGYDKVISEIPIATAVSGRAVRTRQPILVKDASQDPDFLDVIGSTTSMIAVPLFDRNQVAGVFIIEDTSTTPLDEYDLRLMIMAAEHIGIALERARLYTHVRDNESLLRAITENISDVVVYSIGDTIEYINPAIEKLLGYPAEKFMLTSANAWAELIHPDDVQQLMQATFESSKTGSLMQIEYRMRHADGSYRWFETVGNPAAPDQGGTQHVTVSRDITERKQAEEQANQMAIQTRTVQALRSFLGGVSHELRTPLSVMTTSLYLMRRKHDDPESFNRYINNMERETNRLILIVEDMMEISKLDEAAVEFGFTPTSINQIVEGALNLVRPSARNRHQELTFDPANNLPHLAVDPDMLGRAIKHLLVNAIQYTPIDGDIHCTTQVEDNCVVIKIRDTGIGIDPTDLVHIFERFYKADKARSASESGAGLGLPISLRIVEAHKGTIGVESNVDQGSTFSIRLPIL